MNLRNFDANNCNRRSVVRGLTVSLLCVASATRASVSATQDDGAVAARNAMVQDIRRRLARSNLERRADFEPVLAAIGTMPRDRFVPPAAVKDAYKDQPLDIGFGQTISDPFIVAVMTAFLKIRKRDRILEIGTGSGYQAAVLGQLAGEVYTIEIVDSLARAAAERLAGMGFDNIHVRSGDGYAGWPEFAPFDGIIITAGATHIPPALLEQLKPGGRMMIPLGPNWAEEELILVSKSRKGKIRQTSLGPVFFVDFVGQMKK